MNANYFAKKKNSKLLLNAWKFNARTVSLIPPTFKKFHLYRLYR